MKTFQTQCPHCAQIFNISENRLAINEGRGRCPHCKQIFSAKENLIKTPPPLTENQKLALAQLQQQKQQPTPVSTPAAVPLSNAGQIPLQPATIPPNIAAPISQTAAQVTPSPAPPEPITAPPTDAPSISVPAAMPPTADSAPSKAPNIEFDFTDDFAPTGTAQKTNQPATSATRLTKKQKRAKTGEGLISDDDIPEALAEAVFTEKPTPGAADSGFNLEVLEDFDLQPNSKTAEIDYRKPQSSTVTTDATKIGDESWLEDMLVEENIKEREKSFLADSRHNPVGAKADVADLLDDLGVDVVPEVALSKEAYIQKVSQRLEQTKSSQQTYEKKSLLIPLVWGLGCLALAGLLVLQYALFNTDDLMKDKTRAQTLTSFCQITHLPCDLARADLAAVEIKTLSVENNNGKTDILFALTNKSSEPVIYPNLKISLQANNSSVATLVLSPDQYLDEKITRMAPQQIKPIKLRLDIKRDTFSQALIESFY